MPTPAIGDKAYQPSSLHFPKREFGKMAIMNLEWLVMKCSFQWQWFERWSRDEDHDLTFCFPCVTAYQNNQLQGTCCLEQTFISSGFSNWKDAVVKLVTGLGNSLLPRPHPQLPITAFDLIDCLKCWQMESQRSRISRGHMPHTRHAFHAKNFARTVRENNHFTANK